MDTRFMLVTTEGSKETVLEAIKYKVSAYILKPFNYDQFKEKLESLGIYSEFGAGENADIDRLLDSK
jgi:response regulator of citrate/malate metabolism